MKFHGIEIIMEILKKKNKTKAKQKWMVFL